MRIRNFKKKLEINLSLSNRVTLERSSVQILGKLLSFGQSNFSKPSLLQNSSKLFVMWYGWSHVQEVIRTCSSKYNASNPCTPLMLHPLETSWLLKLFFIIIIDVQIHVLFQDTSALYDIQTRTTNCHCWFLNF